VLVVVAWSAGGAGGWAPRDLRRATRRKSKTFG